MHVGFIAKYKEPMPEAGWDPQHVMIDFGKLGADPAAERRCTSTQIDRNIEDSAARTPNQFSLWPIQLIVQAANDVANRPRVIVLSEMDVKAGLFEDALIPRFEKESARVAPYSRRDQQDAGQRRRCELHRFTDCGVFQFA